MARVERGEVSLQRQRAVSSSATLVTVDKQGRVSIDEKLRAYAGLATEQRVVISGNFRVIELWSPERFAQVNAAGTSDLAGQVVQ
jgi:DNA-binding transcriptional regulator/RsmH inhibitor MraZ